ncbi:MAG: TIGR02302 family protein [Hyphomicrobiaceae bacterium]|nr:TIGR02302 family protein [Hyphomicrobiaceae bacterium]
MQDRDPLQNAPRVLERKVRAARAVLLFERVWQALLWPFAVAGVFLLLTLGEVWALLPPSAHQVGLIAFALALLVSLVPLARVRWPGREEALRRLEQVSGVKHRPATSFEDELPEAADAEQRALWQRHRARLAAMLNRLRAGWPHPRLARIDPYALRAALLLLLVVGFTAAGGSSLHRLVTAFSLTPQESVAPFRVDAWVTPPVYTGKPPIVLADGSDEGQSIRQVTTPEKSLLLVRINGRSGARPVVQVRSKKDAPNKTVKPANSDDQLSEYKIAIEEPVIIVVGSGGVARTTWHFDVIKDRPPLIGLTDEPTRSARGAVRFGYRVQDDYGVAASEARFALARTRDGKKNGAGDKTDKPASAQKAKGLLSAFEPPLIPLTLPRSNAKAAEASTFKDLTSHPWAGLKVTMTLVARDHAGQEGKSEVYEMVLPERRFTKPMAKALIEQRKNLVRDPDDRESVIRALSALTIAPDRFIKDKVLYLGMRSARARLRYDKTVDGLKSVAGQLWDLALRVEDGDLPQAEADLRAAQEELRRALENGASEEEIARLMDKLRAALNRFLQAMAEKARQNGDLAKMPEGLGPQQMLSTKDLEQMLRDIENLAKTGSREMAQRMLDQLADMMQRLQMGQANPNSQSQQMMNMVQGLGEVIQRQQKLLDETFNEQRRQEGREGQDGRQAQRDGGLGQRFGQQGRQGQRGEGQEGRQGRGGEGEQGQQGRQGRGEGQEQGRGRGGGDRRYGALSNQQGGIRDRLDGLLEQLRALGARPSDQLEGAGRAMRGSEKALNEENLGRAVQQQTLALDRLRQGTRSMAEQILQSLASRMGQGGQRNKDPLGRPERTQGPDLGTSVKVPDQIDIQRAREILEELRRRLGEPARPMLELDYLERLIKQF